MSDSHLLFPSACGLVKQLMTVIFSGQTYCTVGLVSSQQLYTAAPSSKCAICEIYLYRCLIHILFVIDLYNFWLYHQCTKNSNLQSVAKLLEHLRHEKEMKRVTFIHFKGTKTQFSISTCYSLQI